MQGEERGPLYCAIKKDYYQKHYPKLSFIFKSNFTINCLGSPYSVIQHDHACFSFMKLASLLQPWATIFRHELSKCRFFSSSCVKCYSRGLERNLYHWVSVNWEKGIFVHNQPLPSRLSASLSKWERVIPTPAHRQKHSPAKDLKEHSFFPFTLKLMKPKILHYFLHF